MVPQLLTLVDTEAEETLPSGWLTALGLLLLFGTIMSEAVDFNPSATLALAGKGIDFLSIYLVPYI